MLKIPPAVTFSTAYLIHYPPTMSEKDKDESLKNIRELRNIEKNYQGKIFVSKGNRYDDILISTGNGPNEVLDSIVENTFKIDNKYEISYNLYRKNNYELIETTGNSNIGKILYGLFSKSKNDQPTKIFNKLYSSKKIRAYEIKNFYKNTLSGQLYVLNYYSIQNQKKFSFLGVLIYPDKKNNGLYVALFDTKTKKYITSAFAGITKISKNFFSFFLPDEYAKENKLNSYYINALKKYDTNLDANKGYWTCEAVNTNPFANV